jgi:hypothetical protein
MLGSGAAKNAAGQYQGQARKRRYMINWRVEGAWECEAASADEAQAKFDRAWGGPNGVDPRHGEVSNDNPVLVLD